MQLDVIDVPVSVHIIQVQGRMDASSSPMLKETVRAMTREGKKYFVMDLQFVSFIDSTGLGVLSNLLRAARAAGGDVCLVVIPNSTIFDILKIVRFEHVFEIFDTPEQALESFRF